MALGDYDLKEAVRDKSGAVLNIDAAAKQAYKAARNRAKRLERLEAEVERLNTLVEVLTKRLADKLGIEV